MIHASCVSIQSPDATSCCDHRRDVELAPGRMTLQGLQQRSGQDRRRVDRSVFHPSYHQYPQYIPFYPFLLRTTMRDFGAACWRP